MQDDTYTESYISTIGVDFVSPLGRCSSTAMGAALLLVCSTVVCL